MFIKTLNSTIITIDSPRKEQKESVFLRIYIKICVLRSKTIDTKEFDIEEGVHAASCPFFDLRVIFIIDQATILYSALDLGLYLFFNHSCSP